MPSIRVRPLVWFVTGAMLATAVTLVTLSSWRADAAPGDNDTTFVPITPCRLLDTRKPPATPLGAAETRTLDAHGTNGACTIPSDAVALSTNVTALDATAADMFLTIWSTGVPRPDASSLNPAPGQPPTPNGVTVPLSSSGQFNVFNSAGTVNVLIDVDGYYTKASLAEIHLRLSQAERAVAELSARPRLMSAAKLDNDADVDNVRTSQPFYSVLRLGPGNYRADFGDTDISSCTWTATLSTSSSLPAAVRIATAQDVFDNTRVLVRTTGPGVVASPTDSGWTLHVFC